jgi:hypothetical protein
MTMARALMVALVLVGDLVSRWDVGSQPADPNSLDAIVNSAAAYVKDYQRGLTSVIADEDYQQQVAAQIPLDRSAPSKRRLRSEVFFMFAPASGDWMAIRDVISMDGTALAERPNVREALRTLPPVEVARTFKAHNSRFNLGHISRNFNEPTLSLLLLDDRYRPHVRFTRKGVQRNRDGVWVTIGFAEDSTRTLIRDLSQKPAPSKGEFVVESGTGRIRRAYLVTTIGASPVSGGMTAKLTTTYAPDERLAMWVPVTFAEHYQSGETTAFAPDPRIKLPTTFEEIRGLATYTNYRRFEVKVIIK